MRWNTHEDFQTYPPVRGSARNCLMWNKRVTTASCAGVGHNLGTNRSAAYWITSSARCSSDAAIVGSSAFALFEMCVTPKLSNALFQCFRGRNAPQIGDECGTRV